MTDDHNFFKAYVQSKLAESVLQKQVKKILEIEKTVRVKLAGEVIQGVQVVTVYSYIDIGTLKDLLSLPHVRSSIAIVS